MNSPSPPRRFRLQVSLRMLLVLMAVVGVGLATYRWPWVEVREHGKMVDLESGRINQDRNQVACEVRTTYQRDWSGRAVRNGIQQTWKDGKLWHEAHFYDGKLNGQRRVFNMTGQLVMEAHYQNGKWYGPFRAGDGVHWHWEGNYRNGQRQGDWRDPAPGMFEFFGTLPPDIDSQFALDGTAYYEQDFTDFSSSPYVKSQWEGGKRQGTTQRFAADGELLNSAEYDQDLIVRWNGEPIVEQFRQWLLSPEVKEPATCELLFTHTEIHRLTHLAGSVWIWVTPTQRLCIHYDENVQYLRLLVKDHRDQAPLAATLCEWMVTTGYRFRYAYGGLWIVRAADPEPPFVDPTGIAQIEFPIGSKAAAEWNELIDVHEWPDTAAGCLELLLVNTSLPYDTSALADRVDTEAFDLLRTPPPNGAPTPIVFQRTRRDALGFILFRTGCRCELREGKLTFFPREGRTEFEEQTTPLRTR